MRVLITHPGMQHAHQLAWALHEGDHLLAFWSGVPFADAAQPGRGWGRLSRRLRQIPVPGLRRRHFVIIPLIRRLISRLAQRALANALSHRLDHCFDRWVAWHIRRVHPDIVVCYENSALHTFRAAKAVGSVCVLDAASVHYRPGAELLASTGQQDPGWVDRQKQQEIELADAILTCSSFAADTYVAAGVSAAKLFPCPLGTELPQIRRVKKSASDVCRFVFVGSPSRRKGIDVLLDIFEGFHRSGVAAKLSLIGGTAERDLVMRARSIPGVTHQPFIQKPELFEVVAQHDCLVLPSRYDSFGMVVPEAMSVGVPALVSDRVGAKCIIEEHPDAGWILPFDAIAIRNRMLQLVQNRVLLKQAASAAEMAARNYSWSAYRARVIELLKTIHESHAQ